MTEMTGSKHGVGILQRAAAEPAEPVHVLLIEDNLGFAYFIRDVLMRQHAGRFRSTRRTLWRTRSGCSTRTASTWCSWTWGSRTA